MWSIYTYYWPFCVFWSFNAEKMGLDSERILAHLGRKHLDDVKNRHSRWVRELYLLNTSFLLAFHNDSRRAQNPFNSLIFDLVFTPYFSAWFNWRLFNMLLTIKSIFLWLESGCWQTFNEEKSSGAVCSYSIHWPAWFNSKFSYH